MWDISLDPISNPGFRLVVALLQAKAVAEWWLARKKLGSGIDGHDCLHNNAVAISRYFDFRFFFGCICWYQA